MRTKTNLFGVLVLMAGLFVALAAPAGAGQVQPAYDRYPSDSYPYCVTFPNIENQDGLPPEICYHLYSHYRDKVDSYDRLSVDRDYDQRPVRALSWVQSKSKKCGQTQPLANTPNGWYRVIDWTEYTGGPSCDEVSLGSTHYEFDCKATCPDIGKVSNEVTAEDWVPDHA